MKNKKNLIMAMVTIIFGGIGFFTFPPTIFDFSPSFEVKALFAISFITFFISFAVAGYLLEKNWPVIRKKLLKGIERFLIFASRLEDAYNNKKRGEVR